MRRLESTWKSRGIRRSEAMSIVRIFHKFQEIRRCDNRDSFESPERQKVLLITRHYMSCATNKRALKNHIIIGIGRESRLALYFGHVNQRPPPTKKTVCFLVTQSELAC